MNGQPPEPKGMILAAGLGTRLKPFTDFHPKALFKTGGKTLLEHAITHLVSHGIYRIIINVHHFADQIVDFLATHDSFGAEITFSDERGELLETGGGLKKAGWFLADASYILVRNVDILSDLDLSSMVSFHIQNQNLATLAVRARETSRYLLFDSHQQLVGWKNEKTGEVKRSRQQEASKALAFSGIQVLSPELLPLVTEQGKFSLTDLYLRLSKDYKILGYQDDGLIWEDAGKNSQTGHAAHGG